MKAYIPDYEVVNAADLSSALAWLAAGEGWRPLAGGTDIMVLLNAGKLPWNRLVSIRGIPELRAIEVGEAEVTIGAAATYSQIRSHSTLLRLFPLLCASASWTGGIANQNRGSLGGNIVNASPAADSAPALLAYDAVLELASIRGSRTIPYREFHTAYKVTQLAADELLTRIHLPVPDGPWREYSRKVGTRKAQAISKVCFVARAKLVDSVVQDIRIAIASVAPVPLRCYQTEQALRGNRISPVLVNSCLEILTSEVTPITDIRSTAAYRTQVSLNLLSEFLQQLR